MYYLLILLLVPILFSFSIPSAFAAEVIVPVGSSVPGCEDTNECWLPAEISVNVGETVVWSNDDTAAHTVTSGSAADGADGNFDSGLFMAGTTFSWTADTAGEYPYYCAVHPWMAGVVIVGEASAEEALLISIETTPGNAGESMVITVTFTDTSGNAVEHVNYDIMATQGSETVLDDTGVHDHDGVITHTTVALLLAVNVLPVDITVIFNGFGIDPPFTGPVGQVASVLVTESESKSEQHISISTSRSSYNEGETIVISGQVSVVLFDAPMTVQIFNLGNLIEIVQLVVAQDGSFTHTLIAQGPQWQNSGEYVVRASYGEGNIAETSFQFLTNPEIFTTTGFWEVFAGVGGTFDIEYSIQWGSLNNIQINADEFSLVVDIDSQSDGFVQLEIPRFLIDAKKSDSSDDTFIIKIDGKEVTYEQLSSNSISRTIKINFEEGDEEINIEGNSFLNEIKNGFLVIPISVFTDRSSYSSGNVIQVFGEVGELLAGFPVTVQIIAANGNLIVVQQLEVDSSNKFSIEISNTDSSLWQASGTYTVKVIYGTEARTAETTFEFFKVSGEAPCPDCVPPDEEPELPSSIRVSMPAGTSVPGCEDTHTCFIPFTVSVSRGGTVIWENNDSAAHTVTSGSSADGPNGIFDSSLFMAGATFSHTFDQEGTFDYFCMVHPWMAGQVIVGEGGPTPIPPSVNVRTDQSTYHPGETIEVTGIVRHFDGRAVSLKIVNPFGSLVLVDQTELSSGGAFKEQYKIAGSQWTKSGSYTITVQAGSAKAQTDFFLRIPSTTPPPSQQTTEIIVARGSSVPGCEETNSCFIPFEASVNVGDTVTWFNHDTAAHTVTSGGATDGPNGIFDSSLFMPGATFKVTFDDSGSFDYFCMVHPWMNGIILVGGGGSVTPPRSDIRISLESRESVYDLGDLVQIDVSISGINSQEQVAITVTDRSGTSVISRTLTTDSSGDALLEFRIPEDFRTGTYLVSATASIDGKTYKARDVFKIKSQFNQIRIVSVEPTDQQGRPSDFEVGELGFVKVVLDADKDIAVLITVNLFDSELTTLGIGSLKTTLNDGRTEMILSFMIPDDAARGEAEIFASAFSDWPRNGGIPLTLEVSAEVDIQ